MATLEDILPVTTLLCYPGGTSGHQVISTLHHSRYFARYDNLGISPTGSIPRMPFLPFNERQYIMRLPHQDIVSIGAGGQCWIKTEDNRQWLRDQTLDWLLRRWKSQTGLDIDSVIASRQQLIFHTHLDNDFIQWLLPEARKLFMLTSNSYFGLRADAAKNPDKHPRDPKKLLRYIAMRSGWHVHWSREMDFDYPNSMTFQWSDLITEDRSTFERCVYDIMSWHGFDISPEEMAAAWEGNCHYVQAQKRLGLLF